MATAASPHRTSTSAGTTDTPPPTHDSEGPLSDLRLGSRGRVIGLLEDEASGPIMRRLSNLGFVPGRIVTPLRRAPLGDPVVYLVADYELCLRHHEARIIPGRGHQRCRHRHRGRGHSRTSRLRRAHHRARGRGAAPMSNHCAAHEAPGAADCHCGSSSSPRRCGRGAPHRPGGRAQRRQDLHLQRPDGPARQDRELPGCHRHPVVGDLPDRRDRSDDRGPARRLLPRPRSAPTRRSSTTSSPEPRVRSAPPTPWSSSSMPQRYGGG